MQPLLSLLLILSLVQSHACGGVHQQDQEIALQLLEMVPEYQGRLSPNEPICGRFGVICNSEEPQRITQLKFEKVLLQGPLPTSIGGLTALKTFKVFQGLLTGSLPTEIGSLQNLVEFDFFSPGHLEGTIPTEIGNLKNLTKFVLSGNPLTGPIPTELFLLKDLAYLQLNGAHLEGTFPTEIFGLKRLSVLNLQHNYLSGTLPDLSALKSLQTIALGGNRLTGTIPSKIFELSLLKELDLSRNYLHGTLPSTLQKAKKMVNLDLQLNELTGTIPQGITRLDSLVSLKLAFNLLSGSVLFLQGLPNLEKISLQGNRLQGQIPDFSFTNARANSIDLRFNEFSSCPESDEGCLCGCSVHPDDVMAIEKFNLAFRNPDKVAWRPKSALCGQWMIECSKTGSLRRIVGLDLGTLNFGGTIPTEIGLLTGLRTLDLHEDGLEGTIPTELGRLKNLQVLSLASNHLAGTLPSELRALTKLKSLDLSNNRLSGPLPNLSRKKKFSVLRLLGTNGFEADSLPPFGCWGRETDDQRKLDCGEVKEEL